MQQKCYHPSPFMVNLNVTIKSYGFLMLESKPLRLSPDS